MSKEPLYPRVLRLRHVHPSGWQRLLFWEGSFVVALLLWGADVASGWVVVALPLAVAAVVKANDVLAGLLSSAPESAGAAPEDASPVVGTGNVRTLPPEPLPRFADLPAGTLAALPDAVAADFAVATEMGLTFARTLLERHGGFLPFAAVVTTEGKREASAVELDDDDPDPADVLDELHRSLREQRARLRAAAVLADAQPAPDESGDGPGDVVLVELGHADGPSLLLVAPYALETGVVRFGPVSALASGSGVWAEEDTVS